MKRRNSLTALLLLICGMLSAQTEISTEAGLKAIADNLEGDYVLTADIELTSAWTPLGEFKGTFDGQGHTISGLRYSNADQSGVGFFAKATNATIKRVGFEDVIIVAKNQAATIVGDVYGGTIEECYVANANLTGYEHLGAIAGRINREAVVKNCYASAMVKGYQQSGGIVGVLRNSTVEKCYFSGSVSTDRRRANGIVGLVDPNESGQTAEKYIRYNATLSPFLFVANEDAYGYSSSYHFRIANGANNAIMTSNYALSSTLMGKSLSDCKIVPTSDANYGSDKQHGANLPQDSDAKTSDFYASTLGWDMEDTWKIAGAGYPVLKWQTLPIRSFLINKEASYTLKDGDQIDLSKLIPSHGQAVSYLSKSDKITIEDNIATATGITNIGEARIEVSVGDGFTIDDIIINLYPEGAIQVSTPEELVQINNALALDYVLTADIDMAGVEFTGIGTTSNPFTGTLDGQGHIIRNARVDITGEANVGLFRSTNGATIKRLGVENSYIRGTLKDVGGIIGLMLGGFLEECYVADSEIIGYDHAGALVGGVESGATVRNCYATTDVRSTTHQAGGIAGTMKKGLVEKCFYSGRVSNDDGRVCGIISYHDDSANTVAANLRLENCVNLAPYILSGAGYPDRTFRIMDNNGRTMTFLNNYSLSTSLLGTLDLSQSGVITSESSYYGANDRNGANLPNDSDAKSITFFSETLGWDFEDVWALRSDGYPVLKWETATPVRLFNLKDSYSLSSGESLKFANLISSHGLVLKLSTTSDKINISSDNIVTLKESVAVLEEIVLTIDVPDGFTCDDVINLKLYPDGVVEIASPDDLLAAATAPDRSYQMTADVDMTGIAFTPIGTAENPFTGSFDGNGFKVTGLEYENNEQDYVGLFGYASGATIRNLGIEGAKIAGRNHTGILVGNAYGSTIELCYVSESSSVEGNENVGGIAGALRNETVVQNVYSAASVKSNQSQAGGIAGVLVNSSVENTYFSGDVTGSQRVGGIVALLDVTPTDAAANKIVNSVCLASGLASESKDPMRIIYNFERLMTLTNNYSLKSTLLRSYKDEYNIVPGESYYGADNMHGANIPGGDGQAKTLEFYKETLGWDFETVWSFERGVIYPVLKLFVVDEVVAINNPSAEYTVSILDDQLQVLNLNADSKISVYNTLGQLITSGRSDNQFTATLPSKGIYIVVIQNQSGASSVKVLNR